MSQVARGRATFKFAFWAVIVVALFVYVFHTYNTGTMARWYYHTATTNGYAINANSFKNATKEVPAMLHIGAYERIDGLQAVRVTKGARLPANTNGVISDEELKTPKRVKLEGDTITVTVPWLMKESKGFKYKDTFMHKGIRTNPWAGVWNVAVILFLGLALGIMAEGFTDLLGLKLEKIQHYPTH